MAAGLAACRWGYNVAPRADPDRRWHIGGLKGRIAPLQVSPECPPTHILPACEVLRRHAEGEHVHMKARLTSAKSRGNQLPDLLHHGIRHGKAADRRTPAVHHEKRARPGVHA